MCRLLGIVTSDPTHFQVALRDAPRSLCSLSSEHPDGWGIATFRESDWCVRKGTTQAALDEAFHKNACEQTGTLLISHIRQKTVGPTRMENTHPFHRGDWVFAHNGTIQDVGYLRGGTCGKELSKIAGDTDSEVFFAYLLSRLQRELGSLYRPSRIPPPPSSESIVGSAPVAPAGTPSTGETRIDAVDRVIRNVIEEARARTSFGAFNFLLSDGRVLYAHRFGRSLYSLRRGPDDEVLQDRSSEKMSIRTDWSERKHAVFIASEKLTDEPWVEIENGTLLRIERMPTGKPSVTRLL